MLDDLMVSRWPEALYLVVNGATKWDDMASLREALPDDITSTTARCSPFRGPRPSMRSPAMRPANTRYRR